MVANPATISVAIRIALTIAVIWDCASRHCSDVCGCGQGVGRTVRALACVLIRARSFAPP